MTDGYRRRKVVVLGGLGFIGANLVEALIERGADTTVVTSNRERHAMSAAQFESRGVHIVVADIRDHRAMRDVMRRQQVVFNVAGRSGAVRSVDDPASDLDVNVGGGISVLDALRAEAPGAKCVFASSRLVYGAPRGLPVSEDHPVAPLCPHGLHKVVVEEYLAMYKRLHGLRATVLRITNPYGPGQPTDRSAYGVINFLIHRALAGASLPIYGDGTQLRDYVFIRDVVEALLLAGVEERSDGRLYNVGSGVGTQLIEAARLMIAIGGSGHVESVDWPAVAYAIDSGDFVADVSRIRDELGWQPSVSIAEGLRHTMTACLAGANPS